MKILIKNSWKWLCIILLMYSFWGGLMFKVPSLAILNETIRNLYFHVTLWFAMMFLMTLAVVYSVKYLSSGKLEYDSLSKSFINTGLIFGILGILTGSFWAKFTWGTWWVSDPKLNGAAITILIYLAYFILRNATSENLIKYKISAVYSILAYVMLLVFLMVLPRLTDSLHPGNGGNPGFSQYDLDQNMRLVFYPAVLGFILLGIWISKVLHRIQLLQQKISELEYEEK